MRAHDIFYQAHWEELKEKYHLDTARIHQEQDAEKIIFHVWREQAFSEAGIKDPIERRLKPDLPIEGYGHLAYGVSREAFKIPKASSVYFKVIS